MKKLIVLLVVLFSSSLFAFGLSSGSIISNSVKATYSNSGATKYSNVSTNISAPVSPIFGYMSPTIKMTQSLAPSASIFVPFSITNKGNSTATFSLTNLRFNTNFFSGGIWDFGFYTNSTKSGGLVNNFTLGEDAFKIFFLVVTAPANGIDGASLTNRFGSKISNNYSSMYIRPITTYSGFNGFIYGGNDFLTNNLSIAIIQAPNLSLSKGSYVSNSPSFLALAQVGHEKDLVPGSMIIYNINWTNKGSGNLYGLSFNDQIKTSYVSYLTNSISYSNGFLTAASNVSMSKPLKDDGSVTNKFAGNFGITARTNMGQVIVSFLSNIPGNSRGTIFYKVIVK